MAEAIDPMAVGTEDERRQLEVFLDAHRAHLEQTLDGLTEEEARRRLVPSKTTLLGLLKHLVFVQTVWFGEAVTGTPRTGLGMPEDVDESFDLTDDDTVDSVRADFRAACRTARQRVADLALDDVLTGHPRVRPITLRWAHLQVLRELAHHSGHADILREQLLAARTS